MAKEGAKEGTNESLRVDKWLWYARFFKSRTLAAKACEDGRIRINGTKIRKPKVLVREADFLTLSLARGPRLVTIRALGERRGPASEARCLYEDKTPAELLESRKRTFAGQSSARQAEVKREKGLGRPTKKQRRETERLKNPFES